LKSASSLSPKPLAVRLKNETKIKKLKKMQMTRITNFIIRLFLTAILVAWAVLPYFDGSSNESVLGEIFRVGIVPSILIIGGFFIMVAFYCRTLQKCLTLIKPENRKAKPTSVWYMFAIPFNFVEDFFIVINVANSIEEEKKSNIRLKNVSDFGMVSGIGWSIAQVLSFIPNIVGQTASLIGMILVVYHWVQIAKINKQLIER
jgi:hypothetical protein